ncbi:CLUMA_CG015096, isoform A [Clunio marinus]|uniref:Very-long-chain (3R)-3-hydroxyacyl-CoA dehydratase n=1 Tax=Clunio marinus TaxID=568069 RepID=A0A1J1IPI1_9DIPT|nr:CLUMA_CG015096, isoform A [Clunio marinus]
MNQVAIQFTCSALLILLSTVHIVPVSTGGDTQPSVIPMCEFANDGSFIIDQTASCALSCESDVFQKINLIVTSMPISPFVYWAQSEDQVSLKVDLKDATNVNVKADCAKVNFSATGVGAQGFKEYKFTLDLLNEIDNERIKISQTGNKIDIFLPKIKSGFWSRLICQPQKPSWLKIDFDRWQSEDPEDNEEGELQRDVMKDYPNMYDQLQKAELGFRRERFKKVYLVLYNLFQFVGFMYILIVMGIRYYRDGPASMPGTYEAVGNAYKFVQLLQYLEVMHPLFGYTKGGAFFPFVQISGRAFILFAMIEHEPRMMTKPVVFYLFIIWGVIEIVRYPYYLSQLLKFEMGLLTWLRYSLWIPLYPLGVLCEGIIILRNIPYFEETKRLTVAMPNKWNMSFHMPTFMYIYLIFLILPGIYFVMTHMQTIRTKKLGGQRSKLD